MRWAATRIHGNGTETLVADELPVTGGTVQRALSGTGGASGTVPVEVARLQGTRAAAEQAMLAVSGKSRLAYGTVEPPPGESVLWLRGPDRVPYGWSRPGVDGGSADTVHTAAADGGAPGSEPSLVIDGGVL